MVNYISYVINLAKAKWLLHSNKENRLNNYTPNTDLDNFRKLGLLRNEVDWNLSTANFERKENIAIIASNTFDKSSLNLNLKWRPTTTASGQVATLIAQFKIEIEGELYEYNDTTTYTPKKLTQYGSDKSCLKLFLIRPYSRYRIIFKGYMKRRRDEKDVFVKLNLISNATSKVFDFKEQFDAENIAYQITENQSNYDASELLHDRHELTLRFIGEFFIQDENVKKKKKLDLWGFHSKHIITGKQFKTKRILGHFRNGRVIHVATPVDAPKQITFGYTLFHIATAIDPLIRCKGQPVIWDHINENTVDFSFDICDHEFKFKLTATKREQPSSFMDMTLGKSNGWGIVVLDDGTDTIEEIQAIQASVETYQQALEANTIIDPKLFDSADFSSKPLVVSIDDPNCQRPALVGAKASSLAQLKAFTSDKYVVPTAVMVSRYAYELIQETNPTLRGEIKNLEAQAGQGNIDELNNCCENLERLFENEIKMPERICNDLGELMRNKFNIENLTNLDNRSFAVRSSSWGEDEEDMSAAGQLTTFLNTRGFDQLINAVIKCFGSKFSKTNIEYKRQHGLPLDLPMAVVIQEMIQCDKAGVLFTCDPASADDRNILITANYGLGESVVSGQTDPDSIYVRVQPDNAEQLLSIGVIRIGEKKVILGNKNSDSGIGLADDENFDRNRCCLTDQEIMDLSKCGLELVSYFQSHRDIEWGYKNGQLYLFQSRPVTGLDSFTELEFKHECDNTSRAELEFMSRANICEVMPYAQTPLTIMMIKFWAILGAKFFSKLGTQNLKDYTLEYNCEFITCCYQHFFSLRSKALFNFAVQQDGTRSSISRAMEVGIFGHVVEDQELVEAATDMDATGTVRFQELRFNWHSLNLRASVFRINKQNKEKLAILRQEINSFKFIKKGVNLMEGLLHQIGELFKSLEGPLLNHLMITMLSSKKNFALQQVLSKYIKDPVKLFSAFSKFLASCPDVLSAEIPRRIDKIAKLISQRSDEEVENFKNMTPKEGLNFISSDIDSELAKEFNTFMVKFGHRSYNEFEVIEKSWHKKPDSLIEMIQSNVSKYSDKSQPISEPKKILTIDEVIDSLGINFSLYDRLDIKYNLAPDCHKFVSAREQTKDITIEFNDIVRDATRLLAREMCKNNRIPDEDLLYFFNYEELEELVREPQPSLVLQAIKRRRVFKVFKEAWHFDEIIRGHEVIPEHMKSSKEMDEKLKNAARLIGTTASGGRVEGKVCLINNYNELNKVKAGDILLAYSTDIAFSPAFPLVSGVITEVGGLISHGAVVAREYGLPSVIGIPGITKILKDGERIILDADNAAIIRIEQSEKL